jgi:hypoxanthine phosphoribosyltransferase
VAYQLDAPLTLTQVRFRDPTNAPQYTTPVVVAPPVVGASQQRILLVDDVSVSGQTLAAVKQLLIDHQVTTLVMKGEADYVVFPEIESCVAWPWHVQEQAISP